MFQGSLDPEEILKHFKEDYQKCTELNNQWNAEIKEAREKRLETELEEGKFCFSYLNIYKKYIIFRTGLCQK